jgi:hypothetical protein
MALANLQSSADRARGRGRKDRSLTKPALALLFGLLLMLGIGARAEAATSVQMLVRAGFDGAGKVGGWLPIEVDIRNDGDDIEGELLIVVQDTTTNRGTYTAAPTVYSAPVVLPRRARKRMQMEVRLPNTGQRIRARLVQGEQVLLEQDVQFTRIAGGDVLCGMMARSGGALEFIAALELPPPLRRARLARMEVADLPSRPQLMASLDCLIVDNIPTSALTDGQRDALRTWVANGGLLVVGGGASWQRTLAGLPTELLPARVTGMATVDSLANLGDFGRHPFPDGGQYLASQAIVTDGNPVVEQSGVPLIVSARRGLGTVFFLALDPSTEPLRSWPGSVNLWRYVLSHVATNATLAPGGTTPFLGWGRVPRNAMVDIAPINPPSPIPFAVLLLGFALVVGPGNYLLLCRVGQPTWALVTLPLTTGLGALLAFGLATAQRDSDSILTKVSIVRAHSGAPVAHSRTYVGLLSKQDSTYEIRPSENSLIFGQFYPFPRDPGREGPGWGLKVVSGQRSTVSDLGIAAGSLATFTVDSQFRTAGEVEADLTTDGQSISGTLTNRTGHQLSDASIVLDYTVTRLGDLKPGESREISIPLPNAATAGYGPPNSFATLLYPSSTPQRKPTDAARRDVLDSAFGQAFNFAKLDFYGLTLLGWLETGAVDLDIQPSRPAVVENTLYLSSLTVRFPRGYEGDVPPSLVTHRPLGATTASRQQFGSYDLAPGESIALQFHLPINTGRFLLDRLNLNADGRMRGPGASRASLGEVQFFNWRTSEWEEQPMATGVNSIGTPHNYVSSTGDVRVRYTFRPPQDSGVTGVSFSRLDVNATGLMR